MSTGLAITRLVGGFIGLATIRIQLSLLEFGIRGLVLGIGLEGVEFALSESKRIASNAPKLLLILGWTSLLSQNTLYPVALNSTLSALWAIVAIPVLLYSLYRFLQVVDFLVGYVISMKVGNQLLVEYVLNSLPLLGVALTIAFGILLADALIKSIINEGFQNIFENFIGMSLVLGIVSPLRSLFAGATVLIDKPFDIGDLIEVRGIAGSLVRVGALNTEINRKGEGLMMIPNEDLLEIPLINHSAGVKRFCELHISLDGEQKVAILADDLRQMVLDISDLLSTQQGVLSPQVRVLTPSSVSLKTLNTVIVEHTRTTTFHIAWDSPFVQLPAFLQSRSSVLLLLKEYFETKRVVLV